MSSAAFVTVVGVGVVLVLGIFIILISVAVAVAVIVARAARVVCIASVTSVTSVTSVISVTRVISVTSVIGISVVVVAIVTGSLGHLNWNNTTERTSPRRVLATNKANILLTSNRARAVLSSRDRGNKRKIPHLTIAVTAAIVALNVGGYLDVVPRSTGSISIDHTCIRSSAIRIDLVDSHLKATARVDLRKLTAS